ncbi:LamG-like jellyroll fold domain-containing protein, partial [uncultured Sphingomonas sp.]|uniref:glycosyl hydrolase 2 galactose-binding domain-containing protein n=1 Tax=uncultured Sphingomonas sp. TaxID=158754 RepID=UPI0025EF3C63
MRSFTRAMLAGAALLAISVVQAAEPDNAGPYNASFLAGGIGIDRPLSGADALLRSGAPLTLSAWVKPDVVPQGVVTLIAFGDPAGDCRCLGLRNGALHFFGSGTAVNSTPKLAAGRWSHVAAVIEGGRVRLYLDGKQVGEGALNGSAVASRIALAPVTQGQPHFGGALVQAQLRGVALGATEVQGEAAAPPAFELVQMWQVGVGWNLQKTANIGMTRQQDPWTLPQSDTAYSPPAAKPVPALPSLAPTGPLRWQINDWQLAAAPGVPADGATLSKPGKPEGTWYAATVPGTVLTTLVDRGVYPDPYYGLNNLKIPESLARQDYWYRTSFTVPAEAAGKRLTLVFGGINYASEVWVNGQRQGETRGAFIRGQFEITPAAGENVIAVRVSPPPHPGIPHEQSIKAGVGENGGQLAIDGPTFVATEGWDWIPSVRDRNTGLWQGVTLAATGPAVMGDPQVVTTLPKPDNSVADVEIAVPVTNNGQAPVTTTVRAVFDDVVVEKPVTVAPGQTIRAVLSPSEFPQLSVKNPRLWWPNGYGDPALHNLAITAAVDGALSDSKALRFGMRQVTYDLSLFDDDGDLERVTLDLNRARGGPKVIDTSHKGIRKTANGWAMSFTPGGDQSAAVAKVTDDPRLAPYLTLRVNGVRIAARGGNIGMDDYRKRVDRAHLEPFFRLHRDAHLNIIRNWVGQNTEESFFDLADEYGLMVLSDFWESTQDYNMEAEDPQLFLANATDVVRRFRNHPSIVAWFGRNEGVPQPILNTGLDTLLRAEDGTRLYMPSSNAVNLQGSGPYNWRPPVEYFTGAAKGFSVEVGTPSLPTLESWKRTIPAEADRWPIGDVWAYHDWHQTGNGAVKSFTDALEKRFGAPTGLEDFERKAQMMEYESYRAIFEGMNAGLWTENSGRMLWMTQPAWPSSAWQIFSSDYDTHAAFYGVKKAAEPIHVQMNLPDHRVVLVNNTRDALKGVQVRARVVGLDGRSEGEQEAKVVANAEGVTPALNLDLASAMKRGAVLVRLEATDAGGQVLSTNSYWQAADD